MGSGNIMVDVYNALCDDRRQSESLLPLFPEITSFDVTQLSPTLNGESQNNIGRAPCLNDHSENE